MAMHVHLLLHFPKGYGKQPGHSVLNCDKRELEGANVGAANRFLNTPPRGGLVQCPSLLCTDIEQASVDGRVC
jgi:hypothetical protein